jgi:DNA polymerase III epsilon subunit family exonuclease
METAAVILLVAILALWLLGARLKKVAPNQECESAAAIDLSILERFVIFDFETTGLNPDSHEIIEIGAIRANRDSDMHETFQTFVIPLGRISARITEITGINREMVKRDGLPLDQALSEFRTFVGELPLIAYNADFDVGFLKSACRRVEAESFANEVCCALKMARRAWPGRRSYKLTELARDGGLSLENAHRALDDCHRTLIVYTAAARKLRNYR